MRLVLCFDARPEHVEQITAAVADWEIVDVGQAEIAEAIFTADVFCGHAKVPIAWDDVVRQGRLQWIQSSAAGVDHCLTPSVAASEIVVTGASGVLSDQVAEHTVALVTALYRSLPTFWEAQRRHEFIRRPTRDLHGATIGIVGLGSVGHRVAQVFRSFDTTILATDWYDRTCPPCVDELLPAAAIDSLLPRVDVLILCVPLTSQTQGMLDARRLAMLRKDALVVNVSRGPVVVERDLVDAIDRGRLAGAAVDVTEIEPLPPESRLWDLPGVLITPHVAGQSIRRLDRMTELLVQNLTRFRARSQLLNVIDKELGFAVPENRYR